MCTHHDLDFAATRCVYVNTLREQEQDQATSWRNKLPETELQNPT